MEAIHCSQLYSENAIFSQGIVADEFIFLSADARDPDGSVDDGSVATECANLPWSVHRSSTGSGP